ncbi:MAG TPA: MotA/TolQ/ExbB proton channel family protein [Verrucomicrobiales bacterium]|nr:MotA/TolQ/ExbB proton channel family protein [Verrucomicrobiales bacterium]
MLDLLRQQLELLRHGGWILAGMAALALLIYTTLIGVAFRLREERRFTLSGKAWRTLLSHPDSQDPALGALACFLRRHAADPTTLRDAFKEVRSQHLSYLERRIPFLFIIVSAAPLSGLLGTVVGMLKTFNGLGRSTGISPIEMISTGISQALVTTEAGLLIAIPAYFCTAIVSRRRDRLANSLARLECIAAQRLLPRPESAASSQY